MRDPGSDKCRAALERAPGARPTGFAEAVDRADVIAFALRWDGVQAAIAELPSLAGRIVIDAMNRLDGDPTRVAAGSVWRGSHSGAHGRLTAGLLQAQPTDSSGLAYYAEADSQVVRCWWAAVQMTAGVLRQDDGLPPCMGE